MIPARRIGIAPPLAGILLYHFVLVIGGLMTITSFCGMIATSWVQIVKTVLLMSDVF